MRSSQALGTPVSQYGTMIFPPSHAHSASQSACNCTLELPLVAVFACAYGSVIAELRGESTVACIFVGGVHGGAASEDFRETGQDCDR